MLILPAMGYHAAFRCVAGCDGSYPLDEVIYECPNCGATFRAGRAACPECGSDERTGWQSAEDIETCDTVPDCR